MHKLIITNSSGEFSLNLKENSAHVLYFSSTDISQLSPTLEEIAPLEMLTIELPAIANEDEVKTLLGIIESIPFCNCIKLELPCFRSDTTNNIDVEITKQAIIDSILFLQLKTSNLDLSGPSRIGFFQGSLSDFSIKQLKAIIKGMEKGYAGSLNLSSNNLSNFDAEKLAGILGRLHPDLECLNLSSNNLSNFGAEELAKILECLPLELSQLNLSGNFLSSNGDKYLADILKLLPDKVEVTIDLEKEFFQLLRNRNRFAKLITQFQRGVDWCSPEVSMLSVYSGVIPSFHALGKVVEINLSFQLSSLEDDCLATVGKVIAKNFPKVRILDLSNNDLGTKKAQLLKIIKELPKNITHINLSKNGLGQDTLMSVLAELSSNVGEGVNIKVNVSGNNIDSGFGISRYDNIEIVNLGNQFRPSYFFNPASQIRQYEIIT